MNINRILQSLQKAISTVQLNEESIAELKNILLDQNELEIFNGKMFFEGSGWTHVSINSIALWVVQRAMKSGPQEAVANLLRYFSESQIPFRRIMVLAGVRVPGPIKLSNGIELLSFESLKAIYFKEAIAKSYSRFHPNHRATSALQCTEFYPRDRCHLDITAEPWFPKEPYQQLEDIRLCITSVGPCAPINLGAWTEPDEWVPTVGAGAAIPSPFNIGGYPKKVVNDLKELPEIHARWVKLSEKERRHLRIPLDRINTALRREKIVDSAIDLGIAIDALFLAEKEADRGELAFTLRLRAARYLGNDEPSRREISKVFSALYRMRSMAVHTGEVPATINGFKTTALLEQGYDLVARTVRQIIREGQPNWQKVLFG